MSSARGRAAAGSGQDYPESSAAYQQPTGYPAPEPEGRYAAQHAGGGAGAWAGSALAGFLMILGGLTTFLAGLAVILKNGFFTYHANYAYNWSGKGWGWVDLILGAVVFFAGVCVLLGMGWARIVGIFLATLSALSSFLFLPYYPIWSIVLIAVDVFIIWALASSGSRQRA